MKASLVTVLLVAASASVAQQGQFATHRDETQSQSLSAEELSDDAGALKWVAQSMGRYARDISEIPLHVESTVYEFDANGNEKHRRSSSHSMQFVKRTYADGRVSRQLEAHKRGLHRVSVDEMNGDSATGLVAVLFDNGALSGSITCDLVLHKISKRLEVKIRNEGPCEAFDPSVTHPSLRFCGETHLLMDSSTLEPLEASFEAGGFPATFEGIRYLSFKLKEEFQKVSMPENENPFLLPAKIMVTYESERGKTVIESKFSVKSRSRSAASGAGS